MDVPSIASSDLGVETAFNLTENTFGGNLSAEYTLTDAWAISAVMGRTHPAAAPFWGLGIAHAFEDTTSLSLEYQKTSTTSGLFALSLGHQFGQTGD